MASENLLPAFYKEGHILITGATGFFGKALIEKLLRSCPDVSKLYLLIRCKIGKTPEERLNKLFEDPIFLRLATECPKFRQKIEILPGDCSLPGLGLDPEQVKLIQKKVTVVFHGAATVKLDENLKIAYKINTGGAKEILQICHQMERLKAIVHVSTVFSNPYHQYTEEKFYEPPSCTPRIEKIVEVLTPEEIDKLTPSLLEQWPNTYTLVHTDKSHGRTLRKERRRKATNMCLQTAKLKVLFLFFTLISSAQEPTPGWVDNIYGPIGVLGAAMLGYLKVTLGNGKTVAHVLPIDLAVNATLLVARETYKTFRFGAAQIKVYNHDSDGSKNAILWKDYIELCFRYYPEDPSEKAIWYSSTLHTTKYYYIFMMLSFFLHYLPAYFIDGLAFFSGKKQRMVSAYNRITKLIIAISPFSNYHSKTVCKNLQNLVGKISNEDELLFDTDVNKLDWQKYFSNYVRGYRKYILKETPENLSQAFAQYRRLYWIRIATVCLFYYGIAHFVYSCGSG